jgi:5'-phosphate synthase pdxT subunit
VTRPLVGVLALQGDVVDHQRALEACGAVTRRVRRAEELEGLDGLVLPGGESTAIDNLARVTGLRDPLRAALAAGLPVYGACAGMILLADELLDGQPGQQTFGGLDIAVRRNAFGRQTDSFEADLDVAGLTGGPVHAVFIRAPWVERVGAGVQVLAAVPVAADGGERVVAVRAGARMATSFHPEATGDRRLHAFFLQHCVAAGR